MDGKAASYISPALPFMFMNIEKREMRRGKLMEMRKVHVYGPFSEKVCEKSWLSRLVREVCSLDKNCFIDQPVSALRVFFTSLRLSVLNPNEFFHGFRMFYLRKESGGKYFRPFCFVSFYSFLMAWEVLFVIFCVGSIFLLMTLP